MIRLLLKLQKQTHKIVKGVKYYKHVFIVPPDVIKVLGWDDATEEFEARARNGKLVIEKKE